MKAVKKFRGAPIGAQEYWVKHGREKCEAMAVAAGTTYAYWKRICNLRARPGVDLARRLVALTGGELSFDLLCPPVAAIRGVGAPPLPGGYKVGAVPKKRAAAVSAGAVA